jgi:hypothetical protein
MAGRVPLSPDRQEMPMTSSRVGPASARNQLDKTLMGAY